MRDETGPQLRSFLAERDTPCPNCAYNLRGLAAHSCPECNQALTLQIALADPRFGAWLSCVLVLASVGGLYFLGLVIVLAVSISKRWPSGEEFWFLVVYPACASVLCITPCSFLVSPAGRRWLRKLSRRSMHAVVAACCVLSFTLVAAWAAWLMVVV
ncbi:MAG: hypothetical protein U0637_01125 [Phycisphaerales bacterium]